MQLPLPVTIIIINETFYCWLNYYQYFGSNFSCTIKLSQPYRAADTLSTSRLSYYNALTSLHLAGTTLVGVTSTANLFTGDTVMIGDTSTATSYTVDDIYSATQFTTTAGLDATDIQSGDLVIATRSATHTVTFTTATAVSNGAIRILIPSGTNANNDGIPNHDGFDYGVTTPSLTAPTSGGVTSWETATATVSAGTGCAKRQPLFRSPLQRHQLS